MIHVKYWDNKTPWSNFEDRKLIFEITAVDIFAADEAYQKATGKDPEKQTYVGRQILRVEKSQAEQNLESERGQIMNGTGESLCL